MSFELDALITKEVETLDIERESDLTKIITILKKRPRSRENEELVILYSIIRSISFFDQFWKEFPLDTHLILLRELQYEYVSKGREVFKAGDVAMNFYIILKGSVCVLAPHRDNRTTIQEFEDRLQDNSPNKIPIQRHITSYRNSPVDMNKAFFKHATKGGTSIYDEIKKHFPSRAASPSDISHHVAEEEIILESGPVLSDAEIIELFPNHALLNTLKQEDHFGEIALTNNVARTATVVARENCHLLYLSNSAYRKTLKYYKDKFETEAMDFLKSNPLTGNWPNEHLAGLMRQSKGFVYGKGHEVYKPGDPSDAIYFIREGEIELSRQIEVEVDPFDFEYYMKKEQKAVKGDINNANSLISMNTVWKKKYQKLQTRTIPCAILSRGEMFGDEELVKKEEKRKFRAVVKTITISLIVIPLVKLLENAPDPERFLDSIGRRNIKQGWRTSLARGTLAVNKDIEDSKRQELKEIKELKEHLEAHVAKSMIPVENIKGEHRRVKSMKTASLGIVSVQVSPETERHTNHQKDYLYNPLPGKSKEALKLIEQKQKKIHRSPLLQHEIIIQHPKHPKHPYLQAEKKILAYEAKPTTNVTNSVFDQETNFKGDTARNPKIKPEEPLKLNLKGTEEMPLKYIINIESGNESPSQKIRNSIKKVTKLWEQEYNAFFVSPKKYNNSQENISPPINLLPSKILPLEDISKIATSRAQISTPLTSQKRKPNLSQDEKSKLHLYKSLKLEKIFAPSPRDDLEDYIKNLKIESATHSRKHSALNGLISPKSLALSNSQTHRDEKKGGISRSSTQISLDPFAVQAKPSSSLKGRRAISKKI